MWDDVGILRTAEGLARAPPRAEQSRHRRFRGMGVPDPEKRYNLTWMDRLNLENLVLVSRAICAAAQARTDSRGAHYREDFPETSDLADLALHRRARDADEQLQGHDRAGRVHPREARPIAVAAGGGIAPTLSIMHRRTRAMRLRQGHVVPCATSPSPRN